MLCNRELENAYFLLHKNFKICHKNKNTRLARFNKMHLSHPLTSSGKKRSDYNHVPNNTRLEKSYNVNKDPIHHVPVGRCPLVGWAAAF